MMPLPIAAVGAGAMVVTAKAGAASTATAISTGGLSVGTVKYLSYLGIASGTLVFREGVIYVWEKINQGRGDPALIDPVSINGPASDSQLESDISEKMSASQTQAFATIESETQVLEKVVEGETQVLEKVVESETQVLEKEVESETQILENTDENETQVLKTAVESKVQVLENINEKEDDRISALEVKFDNKIKSLGAELQILLEANNKDHLEKISELLSLQLSQQVTQLFAQFDSSDLGSRSRGRSRSVRSGHGFFHGDSRPISPNPTHILLNSTLPHDNQEFKMPDPSPSFCNVTTGANQNGVREAEQEVEENSDPRIGSSSQADYRGNESVHAQMLGLSSSSSVSESSYGTMSMEESVNAYA